VSREFPEKSRVHLARILADMVDKETLEKIRLKRSDENR
jgi:hypothetical protein